MKTILKFDLPEESYELKDALNGGAMHGILDEVLEQIRQWTKYGMEDVPEEHRELVERKLEIIRELIVNQMIDLGLD